MKPYLLLLISIINLISCGTEPKSKEVDQKPVTNTDTIRITENIVEDDKQEYEQIEILEIDNPQSLQDTFKINEISVTFFILTQIEYDTLMEKSGKEAPDVNETFADFSYHAEKVCKDLRKKGLKSDLVAHRQFNIYTATGIEYFDRKKQNMDMGVIIFDGKTSPLIESGVFSEIDYEEMIKGKIK